MNKNQNKKHKTVLYYTLSLGIIIVLGILTAKSSGLALMSPSNSEPSDECKTYTTPGTHVLSPCDSIKYKDFTFTLSSKISSTDLIGHLVYAINSKYNYHSSKLLSIYLQSHQGPLLTTGDTNLVLEKINYSFNKKSKQWEYEAEITLYETCAEVREICEDLNSTKKEEKKKAKCDSICPYEEDNPDKDYYYGKNVVVSMPKGYENALAVAGKNAENCYKDIVNLFGAKIEFPARITYSKNTSDIPASGCSFGDYFGGGVLCEVSTNYADSNNIIDDEKFQEMQESVNSGICTSETFASNGYGSILNNHIHEITHYYARNFAVIDSYLGEGIASYAETQIGTASILVCGDTTYQYKTTTIHTYGDEKLTAGNYGGGACFLYDLKENFGEEKFKQLFSAYKEVDIVEESFTTTSVDEYMVGTEGCHYLFADILSPIFGPEVFDVMKDKYKLEEDIFKCNFTSLKENEDSNPITPFTPLNLEKSEKTPIIDIKTERESEIEKEPMIETKTEREPGVEIEPIIDTRTESILPQIKKRPDNLIQR
ncbi:hypothetical protein HON58_02035 [Candidatus Peregrinibacteria bacterium]|jgi:hypothetical protein|nr:hypothetical protein [Candidatus Peregrinibacteria bacterium]